MHLGRPPSLIHLLHVPPAGTCSSGRIRSPEASRRRFSPQRPNLAPKNRSKSCRCQLNSRRGQQESSPLRNGASYTCGSTSGSKAENPGSIPAGGNYVDAPPPPPCFEHQCENKGVRSVDLVMNIKTKDLARMGGSSRCKSFVLILIRTSKKTVVLESGREGDSSFKQQIPHPPKFVRSAKVAFEADRPSLRLRVA